MAAPFYGGELGRVYIFAGATGGVSTTPTMTLDGIRTPGAFGTIAP